MNILNVNKSNVKNLVILLLGISLVLFFLSSLVDNRFNDLETATLLVISDQQALLSTIAATTARNGADAVTESIVRDCGVTERGNFDSLLGRLNNNLTRAELAELDRLFGQCGSFYSERKALMVARLTREIEIYEAFVKQLSLIADGDRSETFRIEDWKRLAFEEQKQSAAFNQLVVLQKEIITTLLGGATATSPEIITILNQVREVQEALALAKTQADTVRASLVAL